MQGSTLKVKDACKWQGRRPAILPCNWANTLWGAPPVLHITIYLFILLIYFVYLFLHTPKYMGSQAHSRINFTHKFYFYRILNPLILINRLYFFIFPTYNTNLVGHTYRDPPPVSYILKFLSRFWRTIVDENILIYNIEHILIFHQLKIHSFYPHTIIQM